MTRAAHQVSQAQHIRQDAQALLGRAVIDPASAARAAAAFKGEFDRLGREIEAVRHDRSLTDEQRAAAVHTLRQRQKVEAEAARRRVIEEERAAAKARRAMQPKPPQP